MQQTWIKRDTPPAARVIVFRLGWAGSPELLRSVPLPGDTDLLCLYDYHSLPEDTDPLTETIRSYPERHLVAWSFGVWAAQQLFGPTPEGILPVSWSTATAVNGTPLPVDEHFGIPPRAFAVTVRSIHGTGTGKFLERMCGTPEILKNYYTRRSTRPLDEICGELDTLSALFSRYPQPAPAAIGDLWTRAVIGTADLIFPPAAMTACWREAGVPILEVTGMPHYPLYDPDFLTAITGHEAR